MRKMRILHRLAVWLEKFACKCGLDDEDLKECSELRERLENAMNVLK